MITKFVKKWLALILVFTSASGIFVTMLAPMTVSAVAPTTCNAGFLGFPAWYRGLTTPYPNCEIISPNSTELGTDESTRLPKFIWTIGLNLVEIAIVATAYISAGFEIYGGFYSSSVEANLKVQLKLVKQCWMLL